jgi:hypothetical protein
MQRTSKLNVRECRPRLAPPELQAVLPRTAGQTELIDRSRPIGSRERR